MKTNIALLTVLALILIGCGTLAPGGAYKDKVLYNADMTISSSYEIVHSFVSWELLNRAALAPLPQIREYANNLRAQYPQWHRAAMAARNTYELSATDVNKSALDISLSVLREAVRQANQWFANSQISPLLPDKP